MSSKDKKGDGGERTGAAVVERQEEERQDALAQGLVLGRLNQVCPESQLAFPPLEGAIKAGQVQKLEALSLCSPIGWNYWQLWIPWCGC